MEFKGTRLEKFSVFFSIYLLLSLSMVLFAAAEEKPSSGTITIRGVNDPWNMEVLQDKYSTDALTVLKIDVESCDTEITCGEPTCETPYSEVTGDEELPKDEKGNEKTFISLCDYINDDEEYITLVLDPKRWTHVAVKYASDTELEYYLMDQTKYSITFTKTEGDVKIHTIQHKERLGETVDDSTSVYTILCSADLLGEAKIECNEQMMEIYAIVATYWYFITHFWEFIMASLQGYLSICSVLNWLKNKFGDLFGILGDSQNEYVQKLAQYADLVAGLVKDAYALYEKIAAYVEAALSCKDAYEYIKDLYDAVLALVAKIKGYLSFLENPIPSCLSGLMNKLQALIDKLKGLVPDFIPELDDFLGKLDGLYPDCIKNFLAKLSDFQNLLSRFLGIITSYCNKVKTMKEYYEDPAKGNDPVMASKYATLYVPCGDGSWSGLSFPGIDCTGLEGLTSDILPENCQNLYNLDLSLSLGIDIDLPDACTDYKSILEKLVFCEEIDLDSYKDKYPDVPGNASASCT